MKTQVVFGEESLARRRGKGWGEETMLEKGLDMQIRMTSKLKG